MLTPPPSTIQLLFYAVLLRINFCRNLRNSLGKIFLAKTLFVQKIVLLHVFSTDATRNIEEVGTLVLALAVISCHPSCNFLQLRAQIEGHASGFITVLSDRDAYLWEHGI